MKTIELTIGQVFGSLTVIGRNTNSVSYKHHWTCKCACGYILALPASRLVNGYTKSCGRYSCMDKKLSPQRAIDKWSLAVRKRDGKCLKCGCKLTLVAHHIESMNDSPELALDMNNGATLCRYHHKIFHGIHGQKTTRLDLESYLMEVAK